MSKTVNDILTQKPLHDGTCRIYEAGNDKLLRVIKIKNVKEKVPVFDVIDDKIKKINSGLTPKEMSLSPSLGDEIFAARIIKQAEDEFRLLSDVYGIVIIPHKFEVVSIKDSVYVCTWVPKIVGKSMFTIELKNIPFQKLESLVEGYRNYLLDKYRSIKKPNLWIDCGIKQYMYGHTQDNPTDDLYLIDIDPFIYTNATRLMIDVGNSRLTNLVRNLQTELLKNHAKRLQKLVNALPLLSPDYDPYKLSFIKGDI